MSIRIRCQVFEQPAGVFLLGVVNGLDLARIASATPRYFDPLTMDTDGGVQRETSAKRIKEISEYARSADAAFPTSVIVAVPEGEYEVVDDVLMFRDDSRLDIVDGQHRLRGLQESGVIDRFALPVVFILEPTEEEKALLFATINGKQRTVRASLVYDLFGVTQTRSPQKTAHEIARALNRDPDSPWYGRLKMLGRKMTESETLSQGAFVKQLLPLLSSNPEADFDIARRGEKPVSRPESVFNRYLVSANDEVIFKILLNLFSAVRDQWQLEWAQPGSHNLSKTTGFGGIMRSLPNMVGAGRESMTLTYEFFKSICGEAAERMENRGLSWDAESFPPGNRGETMVRDLFSEATRAATRG